MQPRVIFLSDPVQSPLPWHARSAGDCLQALDSGETGLTSAEAERRLQRSGPNEVRGARVPSRLARLGRQFENMLLYVLLGAAGLTALLGHWLDTAVILGVVFINALVGYVQEGRAERALQALQRLLNPEAQVLRDGRPHTLAARGLVPGDVVQLASGDRVPADLRLLASHSLEVDQSVLTGESEPVSKAVAARPPDTALAERDCLAHAGALITRGSASGLVVATGGDTELGRVSSRVQQIGPIRTPLLIKFARLGRRLSLSILALAVAIAAFGVLVRDLPLPDMLIAAVAIAVAAVPEGLPAVVIITLAIGAQLMARHGAIVRRLAAVETLGEVSIICSDKTGTLTRGEMAVRSVALAAAQVTVTGVGYAPSGEVRDAPAPGSAAEADLHELLRAGLNCNDAVLSETDGTWQISGDPTEGALLVLASKAAASAVQRLPRLDVIPFESEARFMATLHADGAAGVVYLKGAPETVLKRCGYVRQEGAAQPLDTARWDQQVSALAQQGERVLALARGTADPAQPLSAERLQDLELLGLVGVSDPPRPEVRDSLAQCQSAGIEVKIITGDHQETALAVARELGLTNARALTGAELDALADSAFADAVETTSVFARTSPEHKLRLIETLQQRGRIVAMTGDGVNDAPALRRADIGVAMGRKGTEAAREAAEMVLSDDNFATIVQAVATGRHIDDNVRKSLNFLLPTSIAEALIIALAILLGYSLPITPLQILWINMVTAVTLGLALAFEQPGPEFMGRPPKPPGQALLTRRVLWRCLFVSLLMVSGVVLLHGFASAAGGDVAVARTTAVNTLVWFEAAYLISARHLDRPVLGLTDVLSNRIALASIAGVMLLQVLFTYSTPFQRLFDTAPLPLRSWAAILGCGLALFVLVELEKRLYGRRIPG